MKKFVLLASVLVLLSTAVMVRFTRPVSADGTIYIRADGSVEGTTHISSADNITYTFTDNIYDEIVVKRDNIIIDGAGCTLQGTGSGTGIDLTGRSNVTTKNVEIKTFYCGIGLGYSSNNTISGNTITNNFWDGILLDYPSNYNNISGNNIRKNGGYGILLSRSPNNSISGNSITENNLDGILLGDSSNYNSISGNTITNNRHGIWLRSSSNNSISGNNITNNFNGTRLDWSSNNKFYHNNFIDNTQQVYFTYSGYANVWDDGYPSGGNYWSDYTDVDEKSGPNQDQHDSDGIWDHPYVIDGYNQDNYPLVDVIPEFPTWTSMLLVLTVLTVAIAIYKRRLLKTPTH